MGKIEKTSESFCFLVSLVLLVLVLEWLTRDMVTENPFFRKNSNQR